MVSEQQSELVQSVDAAKPIDVEAPVSEETKKKWVYLSIVFFSIKRSL